MDSDRRVFEAVLTTRDAISLLDGMARMRKAMLPGGELGEVLRCMRKLKRIRHWFEGERQKVLAMIGEPDLAALGKAVERLEPALGKRHPVRLRAIRRESFDTLARENGWTVEEMIEYGRCLIGDE